MGAFSNDLIVCVLRDDACRPLLRVEEDFTFESDLVGTVTVPRGFVFDGASIPQAAMSFVGWPGLRAACIHDALLHFIHEGVATITREQTDDVFEEALSACGVNVQTASTMVAAVRLYTRLIKRKTAQAEDLTTGA